MTILIWNITISYLVLFLVLSTSLYIYTKEKSFKYYALYNFTLIIYLISKGETVYHFVLNIFSSFFSKQDLVYFFEHFNWYIQVIFYNLYFLFCINFLDLDKKLKIAVKRIKKILLALFVFFTVFLVASMIFKLFPIFFGLFEFMYLPIVLSFFVYLLPRALKKSGKYKYFLLIGITFYVIFALISFIFSVFQITSAPIRFFFIGIIIENFCFIIGLTYKIKLLNEENQNTKAEITEHKHQQKLTKLNALIEGEENERKRLAQELHDGINCELSAIKFQLLATENENNLQNIKNKIHKSVDMIDLSCEQVRRISHNLSPHNIANFGLYYAVEEFCEKINNTYPIKITYQWFGTHLALPTKVETILYRIIQEIIYNILKHAEANEAILQFNYQNENLRITIEDDGIGFETHQNYDGIGLKNIRSRIDYLNAELEIESSKNGSLFIINLPINKIPAL